MSKVCDVTGKRALRGHKVSHSNVKTVVFNQPNLQVKRFFIPEENRWVKLRVSTAGIREIDKRGIASVMREIAARRSAS
ncbi:MAG: 50S ribosomal protein L28 [Sandaracinaceae bacterium]|nr:50S ribosomal protein L28 [Sandaracinaceae bacterium]MBK6809174.1 50S ribosomal protein L28 [Sandaracinaceae bacterium]MBK7150609.1 50S ribosomal protein L28 [Sandaracinaceae bacterium]MBK7775859.1 50S ribosomal protein L28 [Sandaracinaceae bacterium]MBK8409254.1 50S ribosomal protein L28 [Sandaracinaceae bacterium]